MGISSSRLITSLNLLKRRQPVSEDSPADKIIGVLSLIEELDEEKNGRHVLQLYI